MAQRSRSQRLLTSSLAAFVTWFVLSGCSWMAQPFAATQQASWACPSPTPLPYGEAGPVKGSEDVVDPITGVITTTDTYYKEWEQEYPTPGLSVYPSPTPYGYTGTTYTFGQRVLVAPLYATVDARAGAVQPDGQQLYLIDVRWDNPTGQEVAVDYARQFRLRSIRQASGGQRLDGWTTTEAARSAANLPVLPRSVPAAPQPVTMAILAPAGTPMSVEFSMIAPPRSGAVGTPTGTPVAQPTTTSRSSRTDLYTIQWTDATLQMANAPPCANAGAVTAWGADQRTPLALPAGSGTARVVQLAYSRIGLPYVWGAMGPDAFDCQGLMVWAYGQIGIKIPQGARFQYPKLTPVSRAQIQAGDLVYFELSPPPDERFPDHVGMLGDVDGDGTWDLIHAASPKYGVRLDKNMFGSKYYTSQLVGIRRP